MAKKNRFNLSDRLIETEPKPLGQRIPEPLHVRLLELCDAVYDAGEPRRPTKADLLGALVLAAPEDPAQLIALLQTYGRAVVRDALPSEQSDADVVDLPKRTSGPRRAAWR